MGSTFVVPGVVATVDPIAYTDYPIQASLKDLFWLGTSQAASLVNQVSGRSAATVSTANGSVTYNSGYASFGGAPASNRIYMATTEAEFADRTFVAVMKHEGPLTSSNDWRQVVGGYNSQTSGMSLFQNVASFANGNLRTAAIGVPTPPQTSFYLVAASYTSADKTLRTYYGSGGKAYASGLYTDTTAKAAAGIPLSIGGNDNIGTNARVLDIAMVSQHNAALATADIQKILTYVTNRLTTLYGLPIG
jgi:hypothetical protein